MTPNEFMKEMQSIFQEYGYDKEEAHRRADTLMEIVLKDLGYGEGVKIFYDAPKWYA